MQASPLHGQVTLFPFLTVLLATMGILVVMLVLAVHAASIKSAAAEPSESELYEEQLIALQDDIDLQIIRRDALRRARPGLVEQLHSARMVRANIQSALVELEREEALLARQFETLEARETEGEASIDSRQAQDEQRRAWMQRIELARSRLAELQRHQSNTSTKLYSIVPTRQADGTNRRPIYVECVAEGLILQPYGVQIKTVEIPVPGLPGNPLDAGLSTIREYWLKYGGETNEGHPYPLLVVRPSGAGTYGLARRALGSWTDEFGYELVDQDLELDFGVVDSSLQQTVEQAVHRAKREQIAHARLLEELARQQAVQREGARSEQLQGLQADRIHGGFVRTGGGTEPSERQSGFATHSTTSQLPQSSTTSQNELGTSDRQSRDQKTNHAQEATAGPHTSPTASPESGNDSFASGGLESLAKQRGSNWAIPSAQGVNYRRPVRVICAADHIVVSGGRSVVIEPTRIEFEGDVHQAVEPLVSYVNTLIQSWGPPPPDGHWRPELRVTVVGDAHPTAQRLAAYLRDSGLEFVGDRP